MDITERKTLEAKFLRTQRLESIGMLAGGIAHDLNNLVGPILMGAELLKRKIQDEDIRRTLGVIESGARRAVDVVQQVLTFARGTTGERVRIQVKHLLKEMQQIIRGSFPPSISLTLDYTKDLPAHPGRYDADPPGAHESVRECTRCDAAGRDADARRAPRSRSMKRM